MFFVLLLFHQEGKFKVVLGVEIIGREARRVIDTYDKTYEAQTIAQGAQAAVAASAALEVGAVGLGTILNTAACLALPFTDFNLAAALAGLAGSLMSTTRGHVME